MPIGDSTRSVHAGEDRDASVAGPLEAPIVLSSAFGFSSPEEAEGAFRGENDAYIYGRWGNPNVELAERKIAALEEAEACALGASGMAVISGTMLTFLRAGDHIVAPRSIYGESARLFRERLPRFGIGTTFVDDVSREGYESAIKPSTKVLYLETPSNPTLTVTDLRAVVALARERSLVTVLDNTFATPFCQRALPLGVDVVVHSATKFLSGHGDVIAGAACGRTDAMKAVRDTMVKGLGGALSPFSAYLLARGLRTFALRMQRATDNAKAVARFLSEHPAVLRVHHPSLASHPGAAVAAAQMSAPPAILSFELRRGYEAGRDLLRKVRLVTHAVSLGDTRTLLVHPASTTASTMPEEDRKRAGITPGLLRLALGIEDAEDLVTDLREALG